MTYCGTVPTVRRFRTYGRYHGTYGAHDLRFNSPLFIGGALIRNPRAVPNLCKADSGLSAMIGILVAILILK